MLIRTVLVLMALAGCGISPQEPLAPAVPALYHLEVEDAPAENGKRLNMSLREVQRAIDHSLVEVSSVSGGSVSSSMFVFRGMCGLMRSRGEQFMSFEQVSGSPSRYRVTFPKTVSQEELRGPSKKAFSVSECALVGF